MLTNLEADETGQGNASLFHELLNGLLAVSDRRLLQQNNVLVEAIQTTLDDLGDSLLRLALFAGDLLVDSALCLDAVRRDILAGQVLSLQSGNLHSCCVSSLCSALSLTGVSNQNTDSCRQVGCTAVQVDSDVVALESSGATQLQLLTDLCGELLGSVSCGLTVEVSSCGSDSAQRLR